MTIRLLCAKGHSIADVDVTTEAITVSQLPEPNVEFHYVRVLDRSRLLVRCPIPSCSYGASFDPDEYGVLRGRLATAIIAGIDEFRLESP